MAAAPQSSPIVPDFSGWLTSGDNALVVVVVVVFAGPAAAGIAFGELFSLLFSSPKTLINEPKLSTTEGS